MGSAGQPLGHVLRGDGRAPAVEQRARARARRQAAPARASLGLVARRAPRRRRARPRRVRAHRAPHALPLALQRQYLLQ